MNILHGKSLQLGPKYTEALLSSIIKVMLSGTHSWKGKYDTTETYNTDDVVVVINSADEPVLMRALGSTTGIFNASKWAPVEIVTEINSQDLIDLAMAAIVGKYSYKGSFKKTTTYYENDVVYYDGRLYQSRGNLVAGEFTESQWKFLVAIGEPDFQRVNELITALTTVLVDDKSYKGPFSDSSTYVKGDVVLYNSSFKRAIVTITRSGEFKEAQWEDINLASDARMDLTDETLESILGSLMSNSNTYRGKYDNSTTYSIGDVTIIRANGKAKLIVAKQETSGTYNEAFWEDFKISSENITNITDTTVVASSVYNIDNVTFTTASWIKDPTETTDYKYYSDYSSDQITSDTVPIMTFDKASIDIAATAGVCTMAETLDKKLRIYSKSIPTNNISGSLSLFGVASGTPGSGGGTLSLPKATASTLGAIKLGRGLSAEDDGTVNVDIDDEVIDAELENKVDKTGSFVNEMLDEVYGKQTTQTT